MDSRELLEAIVKALAGRPEHVQVEQLPVHDRAVYLVVRVAQADFGRIVGKNGRTVEALRTIFSAIEAARGRNAVIEVPDR